MWKRERKSCVVFLSCNTVTILLLALLALLLLIQIDSGETAIVCCYKMPSTTTQLSLANVGIYCYFEQFIVGWYFVQIDRKEVCYACTRSKMQPNCACKLWKEKVIKCQSKDYVTQWLLSLFKLEAGRMLNNRENCCEN